MDELLEDEETTLLLEEEDLLLLLPPHAASTNEPATRDTNNALRFKERQKQFLFMQHFPK